MTSLISKIWVQVSGFLHDLVDKSSSVGRTARESIRSLENQIRSAEESVADVGAELRLMQKESDKSRENAVKWDRVARNAVQNGDRAAAVEALQLQVQAEETESNYRNNVERLTPMLSQLKGRLSDLRQKKQEMEHKTSVLDARSKVAQAETRAARYLGNVGETPGVNFDDLEKKVDREEAKAAALADIANDKASLDVNKRLEDYSRRDALNKKMAELGLLTIPQSVAEPMQLSNRKGDTHA